MIFFYLIVLFAWITNGTDENAEQIRMIKEYLQDLKNPLNPEDRSLLTASLYQGIKNLSSKPEKSVYLSTLLPHILSLEEDDTDTRFTRIFFNACFCATKGIEDEFLIKDILRESLAKEGEISDSRYINSISTALEQAKDFKSDYVLPGGSDTAHQRMIRKLTNVLVMR